VQYIVSGQPTGWAAMAKEVRNFDEERVRNCKEDIDTLLVFVSEPSFSSLSYRSLYRSCI
jgi:hypothetical protein